MSKLLTLPGAPGRTVLFGMAILLLTLAGCAAPAVPAAPVQAAVAAAPTSAPTAMTEMATAAPAPATMGAMVMLAKNDKLGEFLADEKGMTLYLFTKDEKNVSNCYDKCAAAWPVLFTDGAPQPGQGVDASLLGTTTRKDGKTQATYNGWPLYYYVKDQKPGDVTGEDVGGVWYVVSAKGDKVEPAEAAATEAPAPATSPAQAEMVKVAIKGFSFGAPLTIKVGTTVEWTNQDGMAHTVTASGGAFDSGKLDQNATFSFTFDKAGTYDYVCKYHGNMKGQVVVTP